jgi:hypothetical protein
MSGERKGEQQPGDDADKAVLEGNAEKAVLEDKQLDEITGGTGTKRQRAEGSSKQRGFRAKRWERFDRQ